MKEDQGGNMITETDTKSKKLICDPMFYAVDKMPECFGFCSPIREQGGGIIDFIIEYVNDAVCLREKLVREHLVGNKLLETFPVHKERGIFEEYCRVVETGEPFMCEVVSYTNTIHKEQIALAYDLCVYRLNEGIAVIWRDITQRKQMEMSEENSRKILSQVEEKIQRFAAIVESSEDAIIGLTLEGIISSWNLGAEKIYGYSAAEVKGKHIKVITHFGGNHRIESNMDKIKRGENTIPYETVRKRKNGEEIHVSVSMSPIFNREGKVVGASAIARDITERKRLEGIVNETEERFRSAFEHAAIGMAISGIEGNFIKVNPALCEITGYLEEELLQLTFQTITHPEDLRSDAEKVTELLDNEIHYYHIEKRYINKSGQVIWVLLSVSLVRDGDGVPMYFLSQMQNITFIKKAMETLEYDKLKTEFFANISHELRTPLNVILSSLQLLRFYMLSHEDSSESKAGKLLDAMKMNCYRLIRLVNNIIDATKIESGFYPSQAVDCDIVEIVEDITASVAAYVIDKGKELTLLTELEEKIICCDPDMVERVLMNLLSNAIKFTRGKGSIQVRIQDEGEYVAISVEDNGIGIAEDKLDVIFERFRQVDKSLTRNYEGSGIGLSLVKSLVELQGGTIEVASELGKGSKFTVRIPAVKNGCLAEPVQMARQLGLQNDVKSNWIEKMNIEFSDIYFNQPK